VPTPTPPPGPPPSGPTNPAGVEAGRLLAGRYRLEQRLASGGMAQVWQGTDEVLRRKVAVKLLHTHLAADSTFVARFRQEAVAAARLAHPGIVSIYDTCSEHGTEAIVMELVMGRTLRERLDDPNPIDPWQAAGLAAQVAEALEAAHLAGLVHRDIKPANVLLSGEGRVKVADFGIAKAVEDADLTQPGLMVGTAKYVAPEQVEGGAVDARTDLYSLGVVLYEMLCGRPPFEADGDAATALARLQRDPLRPRQVRPGVPRALEDVVMRAMARRPADRYATAADLRAALLAAGAPQAPEADLTAADLTTAGGATAPPPPPHALSTSTEASLAPTFRQTERSWLLPTLVLVLVAVALGLASLLLGRSGAGDLIGGVRDVISGAPTPTSIEIVAATAFDPDCARSLCEPGQRGGDNTENDDDAPLAVDGRADTAWQTEGYNNRDITLLKPGVGLVLELGSTAELATLEVDSPTNDWRALVYVADSRPDDLAGWGEPVATTEGLPAGSNSVDLRGERGGAVLVWIVDRGDAPGRAPATISQVRLTGR
jgi:eukaryotic-like serine/threonine-protein kinase